jgi:hypothetical protein
MRISLQGFLDLQSQTIHAAPHVRSPDGKPDPNTRRDRDHRRRSRMSSTRPKASVSKSRSTRMRRPFPSSMTIKPSPFEALAEAAVASSARSGFAGLAAAGATISTATKADPSSPSRPSCASRRQVNSWPPDSPCRRAVAETSPRPPKLSATIRRFSSNVHRRRAPVDMTSMRDTFDIVV